MLYPAELRGRADGFLAHIAAHQNRQGFQPLKFPENVLESFSFS